MASHEDTNMQTQTHIGRTNRPEQTTDLNSVPNMTEINSTAPNSTTRVVWCCPCCQTACPHCALAEEHSCNTLAKEEETGSPVVEVESAAHRPVDSADVQQPTSKVEQEGLELDNGADKDAAEASKADKKKSKSKRQKRGHKIKEKRDIKEADNKTGYDSKKSDEPEDKGGEVDDEPQDNSQQDTGVPGGPTMHDKSTATHESATHMVSRGTNTDSLYCDKCGVGTRSQPAEEFVTWSKYVFKRLYIKFTTNVDSLTKEEKDQLAAQLSKHQYEKYLTSEERILWNNPDIPCSLTFKVVEFRHNAESHPHEFSQDDTNNLLGLVEDHEELYKYACKVCENAYIVHQQGWEYIDSIDDAE